MTKLARSVLAVAALGVLVSGCAQASPQVVGVRGPAIAQLEGWIMPTEILGLSVVPEKVAAQLAEIPQKTYVDGVVVYGLRSGTLLEATLQVSHLVKGTPAESNRFQQTFLAAMNTGSVAVPVSLGGQTVYLSSGTNQTLGSWFRGPMYFVLAIRSDYPLPRTLIRDLVGIQA